VNHLLQITDLHTRFRTEDGIIHAVNGIDFTIDNSETLCIVGESGCGKSVTALSILGLLPTPQGWVEQGRIFYQGRDLASIPASDLRKIRGNHISMIFQEPMTSLNPVYRIGEQLIEPLRQHRKISRTEAWEQAVDMLDKVGIPNPEDRARHYPHELSGGMRQRVMIAMALICDPALLIADEPTTALDVTIQAQILDLINNLKEKFGTAVLMITHDLGVVSETADQVAVMYLGKIVEYGSVERLFATPLHPYTSGLMDSIPQLEKPVPADRKLPTISGTVPSLFHIPRGCAFAERCPKAMKKCRTSAPRLLDLRSDHKVRCWLYE